MTRRRYTVTATREGDWWEVDVSGLDGAFTQARRLDQVEAMARDAIAVMLDVPDDSFDIDTSLLPGRAADELAAAVNARRRSAEAQEEARVATEHAMGALRDVGLPVRDIGRLIGVSHQRAAKIVARR